MFYAGIDWSDTHHDILVIDDAGRQGNTPLRVSHTPDGLEKLHQFLEAITGSNAKENMACIGETSSGLLVAFLLEHGWSVYPVHPTTVDRRRAASGGKTDAIDAYLLAKTGRGILPNCALSPQIARKLLNSKCSPVTRMLWSRCKRVW